MHPVVFNYSIVIFWETGPGDDVEMIRCETFDLTFKFYFLGGGLPPHPGKPQSGE